MPKSHSDSVKESRARRELWVCHLLEAVLAGHPMNEEEQEKFNKIRAMDEAILNANDEESPAFIKRKADILFNQQKYKEAVQTYLETTKMNETKKVLSNADQADLLMKIAYSYINMQDFNNAKTYLQDAKKLYTKIKSDYDIKVIDSTLDKLDSLTAG
ncbi:MAG TPA: tetratricopeptide repeat protein [Candidatus Lokiarchaeia archaeon]|nr:tetratricopeptide repeat protein [Candidatus Lokiarchaeia archaeon]